MAKNVKYAVLLNEDGKEIEKFEIAQDLFQMVKDYLSLVDRVTLNK